MTIVVEATTTLTHPTWSPVSTNTLQFSLPPRPRQPQQLRGREHFRVRPNTPGLFSGTGRRDLDVPGLLDLLPTSPLLIMPINLSS